MLRAQATSTWQIQKVVWPSLQNDDVITNLHAGDGAFIRGGEKVVIVGGEEKSEFVLFDMLSVQ